MIVHNFDPIFIDLGVFQIRWYSIAYIVGIILGWIYAIKIIKKKICDQQMLQKEIQISHCFADRIFKCDWRIIYKMF